MKRGIGAVVTIALAVILCGCAPEEVSRISPSASVTAVSPSPKSTKSIAEQAEAAYRGYLKADAQVISTGDKDFAAYSPFATPRLIDGEKKSSREIAARGLRLSGEIRLRRFTLQSYSSIRVTAYACLDLSAARVLNRDGKDVTPTSRPNLQTSNPAFIWQEGVLKVDEDRSWSGHSIC